MAVNTQDPFTLDRFDYNNDGQVNIRDLIEGFSDAFSGGGTTTSEKDPPTLSKKDYEEIMGLPPLAYIGDDTDSREITMNRILQSMLVISLEPRKCKYEPIDGDTGLDLFTTTPIAKDGKGGYSEMFAGTGILPRNIPLKLAVQNDTSFAESWTSDFGESRFEGLTNVGSSLGQEIRFITGKDSIVDGMSEIAGGMGGAAGALFGDNVGAMFDNINNRFKSIGNKGVKYIENRFPTLGRGVLALASGSKVDFPQIWQGSGFDTTYTFTLKLYNPFPNNKEAYKKYIIEPIVHMLTFVCPVSDSNFTYGFPLLCRFSCPGLAGLDAAYISNLDIIKGGESNDISFKQRAGSVDIRFSIRPLYSTMLIRGQENVNEERPTLDRYINHMMGEVDIPNVETNSVKTILNPDEEILINASNRTSKIIKAGTNAFNNTNTLDNINTLGATSTRKTLEGLDVFSDPILNNLFVDETTLSDINIQNISDYRKYYDTILEERGFSNQELPIQDRIALKIKYGLPMDRQSLNWFWNNTDLFDNITNAIVGDFEKPDIKALAKTATGKSMGDFTDNYNLTSRRAATYSGTF